METSKIQRNSYLNEIMDYLKKYNPILLKEKEDPHYKHWFIQVNRNNEVILTIKYDFYDYTYEGELMSEEDYYEDDDETEVLWEDDKEFDEYWNIDYFDEFNCGRNTFSSFDEIKSELDTFFYNKICFLYLIYNNEMINSISSKILYTKDMNLRRIPEYLKRTLYYKRRLIKNIQRTTATVKVRYFDPQKCFEYQTNYLKKSATA